MMWVMSPRVKFETTCKPFEAMHVNSTLNFLYKIPYFLYFSAGTSSNFALEQNELCSTEFDIQSRVKSDNFPTATG